MKNFIKCLLLIGVLYLGYTYRKTIYNFVLENFVINKNIVTKEANLYYKNYDYNYVSDTTDFRPENKQGLLNIFYTILNNGWDNFEFYCDLDYSSCYDDISDIIEESDDLSNINNMVSPYNSYKYFSYSISTLGKVNITIEKLYSDDEIKYIDSEINKIIEQNITDDMTTREKIKAFHDYIINLIQYDTSLNIDKNHSNKASVALSDKIAVCSGYSDLMSIFLDKLGLKNYKIVNDEHVWNLVFIDNEWLHIDLTWDDPTTSDGKPVLIHDFFLIDTEKLEEISTKLKNNLHEFDKNIYIEAN